MREPTHISPHAASRTIPSMALSDIPLPALIIATVLSLFVIVGIFQARRRARLNEELAREASMRGWRLEVVRGGHIVHGVSRMVSWTFECVRRGRQRGNPAAWWHTDSVRMVRGTIEVRPAGAHDGAAKMAELDPGNPLIKLLLYALIKMIRATTDEARFLVGLKRVDTSAALAQHRIVMATNPEDGKAFLEAGGERALLAWSEAGSAKPYDLATAIVWHRGVELIVNVPALNLERVGTIARLGAEIAEASQRARTEVSAQY
jgi:hypothetical protein